MIAVKNKSGKKLQIVIPSLVILAAVVFLLLWSRQMFSDQNDRKIRSIRNAIDSRALQCYVIEGSYPESLSYLEENYGLAVNQDAYQIIYTPVAENLPPQVQVIRKS